MGVVFVPRTCTDRREPTYAQLIQCVNHRGPIPFQGKFFRTGTKVDEADLRPAPDWPEIPLLVEYAGSDRSGCGHRRSSDIHVLWKFTDSEWIEITRVTSRGPEWWHHLKPAVMRELRAAPVNFVEAAAAASGRVMELLDRELDLLEDEGRERVMSFLLDRFTARMMSHAA